MTTSLLVGLVAVLPLLAQAPVQYGLPPVAGAWAGLLAAFVAAATGIALNVRPTIGDGK